MQDKPCLHLTIHPMDKGTTVKKFHINMIALAISLAFSTAAMAQSLSKGDYKAGKDRIAAEYKTDKAACDPMKGNAKDICVVQAKGKEKVAKAELEVSYKPSRKSRYESSIAKAEADYAVAKEKCDDLAGDTKDVCVKEAKAAQIAAKADAKAQIKTSDANASARETSADARSKASTKIADAQKDARTDKLDAQYSVAKEKCDVLAGNAKDNCLAQAKASFGK